MTRKPIAVVSNNVQATIGWLRNTFDIESMNKAQQTLTDRQGNIYVVITTEEQAAAWEFSSILISPFYRSLLDFCRTRVN